MSITSAIHLPQDQYLHTDAANEWWWHIGTLTSGDRVFGFEINAAKRQFAGQNVLFTEIMLTDVANQIHYQATTLFPYVESWAQSDPSQPWQVTLGDAGSNGAVSMTAPASDIGAMTISAGFTDSQTDTEIVFALQMQQQGQPLLVWGTGYSPGTGPIDPTNRNFYYSFTGLECSGTVSIGDEAVPVEGTTWMDHEYGKFPDSTNWILQDAQLDNGVHLSSFASNAPPHQDVPMPSNLTVLATDGNSTFYTNCTITPRAPVWTSPEGVQYCTVMEVDIPDLDGFLTFTSSMPDQEFRSNYAPVYEGVATVSGQLWGEEVQGPAWIEQALGKLALGRF